MKDSVKKKLLDYKRRLLKDKKTVQRVTSALENGGINVSLWKLPISPPQEDMLVTEHNIKCPLCGRKKASLFGPSHFWHSTFIKCFNCGLSVSDWEANKLCIKEVKAKWKAIDGLRLKDIVPFGMGWHKREN